MSSFSNYAIPRAVSFSKEQMEDIEECLDELSRNAGAWNILLADITGQLIEFRRPIDQSKAEGLAALIAGSYFASAEIIKILGKETHLINLCQEAADYSIYSTNVAEVLILSVVFGNEVKIGVVRFLVEQARCRLLKIVGTAPLEGSDVDTMKSRFVDEDFRQRVNEELERLTDFES